MFERFQKALPSAALLGFVTSLAYAYAFFKCAGEPWLQTLDAADLFSLAWAGAPAALLGLVCGLAASRLEERPPLNVLTLAGEIEGSASLRWINFVAYVVVQPLLVLANFVFILGLTVGPDSFHSGLTLCLGAAEIPTLLMVAYQFQKRNPENLAFALAAYALLANLLLAGYSNGMAPFVNHTDVLRLKTGATVCGGVVFAGERGVIFTPAGPKTEFIRWETVHSIERNSACPNTVPAKKARVVSPESTPLPSSKH